MSIDIQNRIGVEGTHLTTQGKNWLYFKHLIYVYPFSIAVLIGYLH